ncbi:hypothetical protein ID866_9527 [Astraeus odoratus]|nr:hypothetical protein ID866_9527 [Astraeus odoratus]
MSSPHHTLSPHKCCLAKTKAPGECMEDKWRRLREGLGRTWRGEDAAWRAAEAVEERAKVERKALKERLWEAAVQHSATAVAPLQIAKPSRQMTVAGPSIPGCRASRVQDPCTRCHNKSTLCILGAAKGKTMACEACCHMKASCSWSKKMTRETQKQKQVQQSEETEDVEMVEVSKDDKDDKDDKVQLHFAVLPHLVEDHWDTLRALMMMLDKLSMDFLTFQQDLWDLGVTMLRVMEALANELQRLNDLKEEEMGKSKGKGKEKAKEEFRRARTDDDGDTEMGRAGPSSLV